MKEFERSLRRLHKAGEKQFGDDWIPRLKQRRVRLEAAYATLYEQDRDPINYSPLSAQAAYVFAYAPTRAEYTRQFLQRHRAAFGKPLFDRQSVKVVSFGGGPASELVGLIRYLEDPDADEDVQRIEYKVFDKDGDWADVAAEIANAVETDIEIEIRYEEVDAASRSLMNRIDLSNTDLVIFSYVMSELAKLGRSNQIAVNFRTILEHMKINSKILFIDNKHRIFIEYFRSCKLVRGLIEKNDDGDPVVCDFPEMRGSFLTMSDALDWLPRTDLNSVSKLIVRTTK